MLPPRDDKFLLIALGAAAMAVVFTWQVGNQNGFNTGYSVARHLVENSYLSDIIRTPDDVRILSGFAIDVGVDRIIIRTTPTNPFEDPSLIDRTVLITSSTTITKFVQKEIGEFQSELEAFVKIAQSEPALARDAPPIKPPALFTPAHSSLADIKVSNALIVTADSNVRSMKEFFASKIQIQPLTPPMPPTNSSRKSE